MKRTCIIFLLCLFATSQAIAENPIDITNEPSLLPFVGKFILVRGIVTNTKCPSIHGIDMWELENYRGKLIEAEGIIESWVESEEDIKIKNKKLIANRGPGRFFRLKNLKYKEITEQRH